MACTGELEERPLYSDSEFEIFFARENGNVRPDFVMGRVAL